MGYHRANGSPNRCPPNGLSMNLTFQRRPSAACELRDPGARIVAR